MELASPLTPISDPQFAAPPPSPNPNLRWLPLLISLASVYYGCLASAPSFLNFTPVFSDSTAIRSPSTASTDSPASPAIAPPPNYLYLCSHFGFCSPVSFAKFGSSAEPSIVLLGKAFLDPLRFVPPPSLLIFCCLLSCNATFALNLSPRWRDSETSLLQRNLFSAFVLGWGSAFAKFGL